MCPHPVTLAYLFGSWAWDQTSPLSDVDVAVYLAEPDPLFRARMYLPLLWELTRHAETEHLDLLFLNDAPPLLGHQIIKGGRLLYAEDEGERVRVESDFLRRYFDHQELYEVQRHYLRERILKGWMGKGDRGMIEQRIVEERLQHIEKMLGFLRGYSALSLDEFKADREKSHAALYELQTCLEAMTDIGSHLVAALNLRKSEDRGDIMLILAEGGIIPEDLARSLAQATGSRNIIVHGYLPVALDIVYQTIQENLGDIESYCRHIVQYLARQG